MLTNKYKFQNLTPINDADIEIYEDALDYVFSNNEIKNVAISGSYSAGKSSIIETYKKSHTNRKFLHISLAHFESSNAGTINFGEQEGNSLEGKILNQLIHQIEPNKIPQTKFQIKKELSKKDTYKTIACFVAFISSILLILNFSSWKTFVNSLTIPFIKSILSLTTYPDFLILIGFILLILVIVISFKIIKLQFNKNLFKKVTVQGNEIELFEQADDSYFDKYLNEIIYLFENSGADVIVFEDMDRFNSNEIFQRLREVNILVNNKRNDKLPVRFFYLLKDDIFSSKDRTKFFDFILPVVPIVDSSNAYDKFIEQFKAGGIFELFNEEFLQGISLYIDDMRILKNIYNEFIVYKERIGTTGQDANKLLAIIVYKNLFSRDFAQLQLNKGFVYELFNSKEQFVSEEQNKLQDLVKIRAAKIEAIEKETLKSTKEIEVVYSQPPYGDYYNRTKREFIDERDGRIENIKLAQSGGVEQIRKEIDELEKAIIKLQNSRLSEIITRTNIDEIFRITKTTEIGEEIDFNDVKGDDYFDLLKYLIRYGYIDESYPDYMTYFYEHSLSRTDKIFLRSVTDQKSKPYDYKINNPSLVVSRLRNVDFESEETLNFDVLEYLFLNQADCKEKLLVLLEQLKKLKKFDFIKQFIEISSVTPMFIEHLCKHWTMFFSEIVKESKYSKQDIRKIANLILCYSLPESLPLINGDDEFLRFIENDSDFLNFKSPDIDKMIESLKSLKIKFSNINISNSDTTMWNEIYTNNLYQLNWNMLKNVLIYEYKVAESDLNLHNCLTLVLSKKQTQLCSYVEEKINECTKVILKNCNDNITDDEDVVLWVLNNPDIEFETKQQYIKILATKITQLNKVDDRNLWKPLIDAEIVACFTENVLCYFINNGQKYDDSLVGLLNDSDEDFTFDDDSTISKFGDDVLSAFFDETVKCNDLENNCYAHIVDSLNYYYPAFSFDNIEKDKMVILLDGKTIKMNPENLEFLRKSYPDSVVHFIESQPKAYIEDTINEDNFIFDELIEVLKSNVDISTKLRLLSYTNKPISIAGKTYHKDVKLHILKNNFQTSDLDYILREYDAFSKDIKTTIISIAENNIGAIISRKISLQYVLLIELLKRTTINELERLEVFSYSLSSLDFAQCKSCLTILDESIYLSLFEGKRPKIVANETSKRILDIFKENSWISKYELDEDRQHYRVIGRKTRIGFRYI